MLCQDCRQRMATVVLTEISEGTKQVRHLCTSCVEDRGVPTPVLKKPVQPEVLFRTWDSEEMLDAHEADRTLCAVCGWSFSRFRESGLLGCPDCYEAFGEGLRELLPRIHGAGEHLGAAYEPPVARAEEEDDPARLREALQAAVEQEEFERAAALRDRLHQLERKGS